MSERSDRPVAGPYGAVEGALRRVLAGLPMRHPARAFGAADGPGRYRLWRAVRRLLEDLARAGGAVLLLDDLHLAAAETVELLAHLVRHPPDAPLVLALAYRPREARPALPGALLGARAAVHRLAPGPLAPADIALLHADPVTVWAVSGGNPRIAAALAGHGTGESAAEFVRLPAAERALAEAAALAGDPFDPAAAAFLAALDLPSALPLLDALAARDLVRGLPHARFAFRDPLLHAIARTSALAARGEAGPADGDPLGRAAAAELARAEPRRALAG